MRTTVAHRVTPWSLRFEWPLVIMYTLSAWYASGAITSLMSLAGHRPDWVVLLGDAVDLAIAIGVAVCVIVTDVRWHHSGACDARMALERHVRQLASLDRAAYFNREDHVMFTAFKFRSLGMPYRALVINGTNQVTGITDGEPHEISLTIMHFCPWMLSVPVKKVCAVYHPRTSKITPVPGNEHPSMAVRARVKLSALTRAQQSAPVIMMNTVTAQLLSAEKLCEGNPGE